MKKIMSLIDNQDGDSELYHTYRAKHTRKPHIKKKIKIPNEDIDMRSNKPTEKTKTSRVVDLNVDEIQEENDDIVYIRTKN